MNNRSLIIIFTFIGLCSLYFSSCNSEEEITYLRYYTSGKKLYESNCQNCHNTDGAGLAMLYPPLTDTLYLKKNKKQLACFIKNGLQDSIVVAGKPFNGQMPANPQLTDIEIAEIITYITNSFGNKQQIYLATEVNKDLKNCN